jgi:hypothetical protein
MKRGGERERYREKGEQAGGNKNERKMSVKKEWRKGVKKKSEV